MAQWLTSESYGNGGDGAITYTSSGVDTTANTTATGTSGTTAVTAGSGTGFAANNIVLIHQSQLTGVGSWELNVISSVGGGTNWTMKYALANTYSSGGQVYLLKQYSAFTINSGVTVTNLAWSTTGGIFAALCNGTISIPGTIDGSARGFAGATLASGGNGRCGEGTTGGSVQQTTAQGNGGGGATLGTTAGSGGGGGGNGVAGNIGGTAATSTPGDGGNAVGNSSLTSMMFGGGGGKGGDINSANNNGGSGGKGGGIILLIAPTITITGSLTVNGANGSNGAVIDVGGGGGGGGGSILLKGKTITLGTNLLTATGGTRGSASGAGEVGGNGGAGRIHVDYANSLSGSTNPTLTSTVDSTLNTLQFGSII